MTTIIRQCASWQSVPGWFEDDDACALLRLMARLPRGARIANVGTFCGRNLAAVSPLIRLESFHVLAIDTFEGTGNANQGELQGDWATVRGRLDLTLLQFGLVPHVDVLQCDSVSAAQDCARNGEKFDLIFLDADHSYEAVRADIAAWLPLVNSPGIIAGHDFGDAYWPGVERAVREMLPGAQVVVGSTVWWVMR